jgi:hypothetical protein
MFSPKAAVARSIGNVVRKRILFSFLLNGLTGFASNVKVGKLDRVESHFSSCLFKDGDEIGYRERKC